MEAAQDRGAQYEEGQRQEALRKKQLALAADFEDPGGVQQDIYSRFRNERLKDLSSDQQKQQRSLSRRGLGYGGIAQGANAELQGESDYDMQTGKFKIKSAAEEQAAQIKADALGNAIKERQNKQVIYDQVYNSALTEYRNRRQALKAIGQGVGMVAGGVGGAYAGGEIMS